MKVLVWVLGLVCLASFGCENLEDDAKKLMNKTVKGDGYVCEPGETQMCWCPDDGEDPTGAQRCNTNGKFWWKCYCSTTDDAEFQDLDRSCKDKNTNEECSCEEEDAIPIDEDDVGDPDDIVKVDPIEDDETDPVQTNPDPNEDKDPVDDVRKVEFVEMDSGTFQMGSLYSDTKADDDEYPMHPVYMQNFLIMKTEVTVGMYRKCVDSGECDAPLQTSGCTPSYGHNNFFKDNSENHAVNCVDWFRAEAFCEFIHARLPSESEWEYAARSNGTTHTYPWGESSPSPDVVVAVGAADDLPVCSKDNGNTSEGLCDMAGNMEEWVQDYYKGDYAGAPNDGTPWMQGSTKVSRGGNYQCSADRLRTRDRKNYSANFFMHVIGFRCAQDLVMPGLPM